MSSVIKSIRQQCLASCMITAYILPVCDKSCKVNRETMSERAQCVCRSPVINYFKFSSAGNPSLEQHSSSYITFWICDLTHYFKGARNKMHSCHGNHC